MDTKEAKGSFKPCGQGRSICFCLFAFAHKFSIWLACIIDRLHLIINQNCDHLEVPIVDASNAHESGEVDEHPDAKGLFANDFFKKCRIIQKSLICLVGPTFKVRVKGEVSFQLPNCIMMKLLAGCPPDLQQPDGMWRDGCRLCYNY